VVEKKRQLVNRLIEKKVTAVRAVGFVGIMKSSYYYRSSRDPDEDDWLCKRILEIALKYSFFGYRRIYRQLRREGFEVNHKKVYRLYRQMDLRRPKKKKKKKIRAIPRDSEKYFRPAERTNDIWVTDFIEDTMTSGRKVRVLAIEDQYSRKVVGYRIGTSIRGCDVVDVLEQAVEFNGRPCFIRSDNGPEYISDVFAKNAYRMRITHERINPGKPVENCYAESFMSRFRDECLNLHLFKNIREAVRIIDKYIEWYNNDRLHSGLDYRIPAAVHAGGM
jgi:putative transposase